MAREFTSYVVLRHPDTLQAESYKPGDEVPEWATVGDHVATSQGVTRDRQSSNGESTPNDPANATEGATVTIVTPQHEQDDSDDADSDDDSLPPYEEWSKTDLRSEVDGRELDVPKRATVDELVEALKADDAANPE